jgi:2-oxoglutarate ferredoxin oxidoreductase subunit delta
MSRIVIDENRCKGCGLCTTACPFDLIHIADRFNTKGYQPAEFTEGCPQSQESPGQARQCTGCANCASMCPDVAITVYRTRSALNARTRAPAKELATQISGDSAKQQDNKKNGRERQAIQVDTLHPADTTHPTTQERR